MYKRYIVLVLILFSAFPDVSYSQVRHIVVIGVDGMGSYGIKKSETPVMDSLMKHGAYTLKAKAVYPTLSSPNWASMISGVPPKVHGIRSNDWEEWKNQGSVVTVFKAVRQERPFASIAVFHQWKEFDKLVEPGVAHMVHTPYDDSTALKAGDYIKSGKPLLTFIHLDLVDKAGHTFGVKSCEYRQSITRADSLIGLVTNAVREAGIADSTLIIITSDHGFKGKNHGGWSKKTRQIPWLSSGPMVRKGWKIPKKPWTYNTAPTIAYLLSIRIPDTWQGKAMKEILIAE